LWDAKVGDGIRQPQLYNFSTKTYGNFRGAIIRFKTLNSINEPALATPSHTHTQPLFCARLVLAPPLSGKENVKRQGPHEVKIIVGGSKLFK
jgi:hypothetical protein